MGRSIVTSERAATRSGPGGEPRQAAVADKYSDVLLKLIPAEVIGVYLAMQAFLTNDQVPWWLPLAVFLFGIFATVFYLRLILKVTSKLHILLSVGAFCVWAYSTSSPEQLSGWYNESVAGVLLLAYTFLAPKIPLRNE